MSTHGRKTWSGLMLGIIGLWMYPSLVGGESARVYAQAAQIKTLDGMALPRLLEAIWTLEGILAAVFIFIYAAGRFNTPPTSRSSTTWIRYYTAAGFYCTFAVSLYLGLVCSPSLLKRVMQETPLPSWAEGLSIPLLVALVLTVLLPTFPGLATVDEWIRKQLQYRAAIPLAARWLSAALAAASFEVPAGVRERIAAKLADTGLDPRDIIFDDGPDLQHLWTKIAVLIHQLSEWEAHRRFGRFIADFPEEMSELRRRYDQLLPQVGTCLRVMRELSPDGPLGKSSDAVAEYRRNVQDHADELLQSLYHFISRGVLQCELTATARYDQLQAIGFHIEKPHFPLTLHQWMALFMGMSLAMAIGFVVSQDGPLSVRAVGIKSAMVASIFIVAVCCAIYPKVWEWKITRPGPDGFPPVTFYLVAGILAVLLAIPINFGFKLLISLNPHQTWAEFLQRYPWLFMSFITAFLTACLSDIKATPSLPLRRLRWVQGLTQGSMMMITGWIVHAWLTTTLLPPAKVPELLTVLLLSGVIGFGIGFCVPTWYQKAPRQRDPAGDTHYAMAI
ncbi:MAG TPA: hypothetical protein VLK82_08065 [Candidatus Tectomicrobia bacterium]|nr:hypothetical protein [Candidatus Tectomicrobia bacterium]